MTQQAQAAPAAITYTSEEQVTLKQLQENGRVLANLKALLNDGTYPGKVAVSLIESLNFTNGLIKGTEQRIATIIKQAEERATNPTPDKQLQKTTTKEGATDA